MKRKIIIGSVIAVLTVAFSIVGILGTTGSASVFKRTGGPSVRVVEIRTGSISTVISADGTVKEVEKAQVYFDTPLKVIDILVEKNQHVSKGQKLIELDLSGLYSELEKLEINRNVQQLNLEMSEMEEDLKKAAIAVENARKTYEECVETYEENKILFESHAISEAELKRSQRACEDALSALRSSELSYESLKKNMEYNRKIKFETLQSTILGIEDLKEKIDRIEKDVLSPMDGVVSVVNVIKGGYTGTMPAFEIINTDKLKVHAYIKEYNSGNVKVGQPVSIWGDAIGKDTTITGKVESISPKAESIYTGGGEETVVETVISLENTVPGLRPGISVTCDISTENVEDVLIIPLEAIVPDKDGLEYVFTVDENTGVLARKRVTLGIISDMTAQVISGLSEGELVVLDPQPYFEDGMTVSITEKE